MSTEITDAQDTPARRFFSDEGAMSPLGAAHRYEAARRRGGPGKVSGPHGWRFFPTLPLLVLPVLALMLRDRVVPWIFMWLMALALFAGFKWMTLFETMRRRRGVPVRTRVIYGLLWPGMSLEEFAGSPPRAPGGAPGLRWLAPVLKAGAGAGLVWMVVPLIPVHAQILGGWIGMIGIVMMLHFGAFQLLALALQGLGFHARPLMDSPLLARSLADFWGRRWNSAFHALAERYGFRPLTPRVGPRGAIAIVFLASGLLHEAVITVPARGGYGLPSAYFGVQAVGMLGERLPCFRNRPFAKRMFAWLFVIGPLGLLFPPPFVCRVILPMLHATGVTEVTP